MLYTVGRRSDEPRPLLSIDTGRYRSQHNDRKTVQWQKFSRILNQDTIHNQTCKIYIRNDSHLASTLRPGPPTLSDVLTPPYPSRYVQLLDVTLSSCFIGFTSYLYSYRARMASLRLLSARRRPRTVPQM